MLKKLISYEFKATGRTLGILYLALIILSCVCRLIFGLSAFDEGTNFCHRRVEHHSDLSVRDADLCRSRCDVPDDHSEILEKSAAK